MLELPIQLPEYWIRPRIMFVYANGFERPGDNLQMYECEEDMEATADNAFLMLERVPEAYRASVSYVLFERAQPIQKVRYGQGELADDGRLYVGLMEFSVAQTYAWFYGVNWGHNSGRPALAKPIMKKGTGRMQDTSRVYIK